MVAILNKKKLSNDIYEIVIDAPNVSENAKPGQFFMLQATPESERVALSISDWDAEKKTVTFVIMKVGESSGAIVEKNVGEEYYHVCGPLGNSSDLCDMTDEELSNEKVVFLAGGVGAAPVYPQAKFLHDKGYTPTVILAARNESLILYEEKLKSVADVHIATDDGSRGFHGLVTDALQDLVDKGMKFTRAVAIGPMIMMKFAVIKAESLGITSVVSLNPIMLDGTGMCGCCRCKVDGETRYACVDGPEFFGKDVDFDEALRRLRR